MPEFMGFLQGVGVKGKICPQGRGKGLNEWAGPLPPPPPPPINWTPALKGDAVIGYKIDTFSGRYIFVICIANACFLLKIILRPLELCSKNIYGAGDNLVTCYQVYMAVCWIGTLLSQPKNWNKKICQQFYTACTYCTCTAGVIYAVSFPDLPLG